jgi:CheY-like chemotaxis protein
MSTGGVVRPMSGAFSNTILNIHDDEAVRRRRTVQLRGAGFALAEAGSAREGLSRLRVLRPALVVLALPPEDRDLPELVAAVRRDHPGTLILETAAPDATRPRVHRSEGADALLRDPVEADELIATVELLLRLGAAETALAAARRGEPLGRFGTDFVHDFNNHITAISGSLELMLARPDDERRIRWAENALEAVQRASLLITERLAAPSGSAADTSVSAVVAPPRSAAEGDLILIVDDENHVRSYVADLLLGLGYRTLEADDGPAALAALETAVPDLLIVDFAMPGMTGAELALRVLGRAPDARFLFMTGHADSVPLTSLAPDVPMIRKPFRSEDLLAAVREALAATP